LIAFRKDQSDLSKWNIYITPNVTQIKGFIFADGILTSVDSNKEAIRTDTPENTLLLWNQLTITGTIFTRNTVGGSILSDKKMYIWQGNITLTDTSDNHALALQADLNFLRRWHSGSTNDSKNPLIIKYDSSFIMFPPTGLK
jgi:outer membrane protein assembly factor BamB